MDKPKLGKFDMLISIFKWEAFIETVAESQKFLDWDLSPCENHIWLGHVHVVFNRQGECNGNTGGPA